MHFPFRRIACGGGGVLIAAAAFFITKPEKVTPTLSMIAPEVLDNLLNPQTAPAQHE